MILRETQKTSIHAGLILAFTSSRLDRRTRKKIANRKQLTLAIQVAEQGRRGPCSTSIAPPTEG